MCPTGIDSAPDDGRLYAPSTDRNRDVILEQLQKILPSKGAVLEIASGSGQHAVYWAQRLPGLLWVTSDIGAENLRSIKAWNALSGTNLPDPVTLDVTALTWPVETTPPPVALEAMVNINMIHISPWATCQGLMAGAGRILPQGGPLVLYGPFRKNGAHTAPSNVEFDVWLKDRDPANGVRGLEDVTAEAEKNGLYLDSEIAMPANNFLIVYRKS